jgi:endonuclease/exonuclease/phosphatase (EEP) superfamily protein YafD
MSSVDASTPATPSEPTEHSPATKRVTIGTRVARWLWVVVVLTALAYVVAWAMPQWFDVQSQPYLTFVCASFFLRVFQMHIGAALLPLALLALGLRRWKLLATTTALSLLLMLPALTEFVPRSPAPIVGSKLKILSFNLWAMNKQTEKFVGFIDRTDADIVVLNEVTSQSFDAIYARIRSRYPHVYVPRSAKSSAATIISKRPFKVEPSLIAPKNRDARRRVIFELDGREFALYGVHLLSPGDPQLIADNRVQVQELLAITEAENLPVMFVGDHNFSPLTANYRALAGKGLRSTHDIAGHGLGGTWAPRWDKWFASIPGIRIDHILMSPAFTAASHVVGEDAGSDHRPIIAEIGWVSPAR